MLSVAVSLAGCKAGAQPDPQPPATSPSIGWNTSAQEPLPAEISPNRFRKVCRRVAELNREQPSEAELHDCTEAARLAWQQDPVQFDTQERCFFDNDDLTLAETCASEAPETPPQTDPELEARARVFCQHLVDLAEKEGVGLLQSVDDCVASSLEERANDPAAFDRWTECVPKASSMLEALKCANPPT